MTDPDHPIELTAQDARGGESTGRMRYVLGFSLILIIIVFAVLFLR